MIFRFAGNAWISTLAVGGGRWEVRVKGNLTTRADTGLINSSPICAIFPVVRLRQGHDHTIQIPGKHTKKYFSPIGPTSSSSNSMSVFD